MLHSAATHVRRSLRAVERAVLSRSVVVALSGPLLVVALCIVRSPAIIAGGRLWAEEVYFVTHMLATKSVPQQVFYVYRGHIELLNSLVFAIASHLGLKTIPLATTYCGLVVECTLAFLIVFFRRDLEIRLRAALLICVLIVVSPCAAENYLNMLNSVWVTAAILLLIIQLPPERLGKHGPLLVGSTLVMGLSGIPATSLMPVAFLHWLAWRSRPHLLITVTLAVCGLVQGALLLTHGVESRFSEVSAWIYLTGPFLHIVAEHSMGVDAASALGHWFRDFDIHSVPLPSFMLAPIAILAWMTIRVFRPGNVRTKLLVVALIYTTTFNIAFALGDRDELFTVYGMRYFFVPCVALALLLARADGVSSRWPPGFALGVLLLVACVSTKNFFENPFNRTYVEQRHDWRRGVELCEARGTACSIEIDPGGLKVDIPEASLHRTAR